METRTIGKDPVVEALLKAGYEISADQTPRTTKKKKLVDTGWKRYTLEVDNLVDDEDGVWAKRPDEKNPDMINWKKPFLQHCRGGGSVYEQAGVFYNAKGNPMQDFTMDW